MVNKRTKPYGASPFKEEWDVAYRKCSRENPYYDRWLEKYDSLLTGLAPPLLDLGSGYGNDTMWLRCEGRDTVSCDYSLESLRRLRRLAGETKTICCDMLQGLPFQEGTFGAVVANLSLHYFSWRDTVAVFDEIRRVLTARGALFCRMKSLADSEYGQGDLIEKNYFSIGGRHKRFFAEDELQRLFRRWEVHRLVEGRVRRFKVERTFWEAAVRKK